MVESGSSGPAGLEEHPVAPSLLQRGPDALLLNVSPEGCASLPQSQFRGLQHLEGAFLSESWLSGYKSCCCCHLALEVILWPRSRLSWQGVIAGLLRV